MKVIIAYERKNRLLIKCNKFLVDSKAYESDKQNSETSV